MGQVKGFVLGFLAALVVFAFLNQLFFVPKGDLDAIDFNNDLEQNKSVVSVVEEVPEVETPVPIPAPIVVKPPRKKLIRVYPSNSDSSSVFTTLKFEDVSIISTEGEWSQIISSTGMPVWIRGDLIEQRASGYMEVIVGRANTRSAPNQTDGVVMGKLVRGEIIKVSKKSDGWARVWSPIRFSAWIKTSDIETL